MQSAHISTLSPTTYLYENGPTHVIQVDGINTPQHNARVVVLIICTRWCKLYRMLVDPFFLRVHARVCFYPSRIDSNSLAS